MSALIRSNEIFSTVSVSESFSSLLIWWASSQSSFLLLLEICLT